VSKSKNGHPTRWASLAIAAAALALARVLDGRAVSSHPSAARVLTKLLDELRKPVPGRKGALKLVRQMSNPQPSQPAKPPVGT
jgi:hypothetical protein